MSDLLFSYDDDGHRRPLIRRTLIGNLITLTCVAVVIALIVGGIWSWQAGTSFLHTVSVIAAVVGFAVLNGIWWWVKGAELDDAIEAQENRYLTLAATNRAERRMRFTLEREVARLTRAATVDYDATGE